MSAWTCRLSVTARPTERLFHLILESHHGRALVPIPKRSASLRATSTLNGWRVCKRLTPTGRLEKRTSDRLFACRLRAKIGNEKRPPLTRLSLGLSLDLFSFSTLPVTNQLLPGGLYRLAGLAALSATALNSPPVQALPVVTLQIIPVASTASNAAIMDSASLASDTIRKSVSPVVK
jgi:hypothetical protein